MSKLDCQEKAIAQQLVAQLKIEAIFKILWDYFQVLNKLKPSLMRWESEIAYGQ
jgi:hypothetical protein